MGYLNEQKRIANQANEFDQLKIVKDGELAVAGDKTTTCIIWNNMIGANFDNADDHNDYLQFLKNSGLKDGRYSIVGDNTTELQSITMKFS